MTLTLALLTALTASAQETPLPAAAELDLSTVYAGLHGGLISAESRPPISGGLDVVLLLPSVRARIRAEAYQQPDAGLELVLNTLAGTEDGPLDIPSWLGNQMSAEVAWRSPTGLLFGGRDDRFQTFSRRGMSYLTDELQVTPDHDRAWLAGPTVGALTQSERYDLGAQVWLGLPLTTRMTPGASFSSTEENPSPRDLLSTRAELTGLARVHQGRWFASLEGGVMVRRRTRYQTEVMGFTNTTQADPIVRASAGVSF